MKKTYATLLLVIALGLLPWGATQTRTDLFDLKKSQQELEIMRGILSTTLGFVMKELRGKDSSAPEPRDDFFHTSWRFTNVSAFYLYGQGAIFIIPASSFRSVFSLFDKEGRLWDAQEHEIEAAVTAAEAGVQVLAELKETGGVVGGVLGGVVGGVPGGVEGGIAGGVKAGTRVQAPVAPQPPPVPEPPPVPSAAAPTPAPKPARSQDEIRKKLFKAQEEVKQRRDQAEAKRAKFLDQLAEIKVYLVEALANHGDSLTHVKPNEYITILITSDEGDMFKDSTRSHREVLSVQKSAVMDYKAGKLSLDAFKQKVLNYNN